MPRNVARFEQISYIANALGLVIASLDDARLAAGMGWSFLLIVQLAVFAILILLIWLIARRRKNWARWVLLALFVFGLPGAWTNISSTFPAHAVVGVLMLVQAALQAIAIFFVFTGNARGWFSKGRHEEAT